MERLFVNFLKVLLTIVDMPYKTYENKKLALINARDIIKYTKCHSVKLETDENKIEIVKHLTKNGIKVVTHIGVTPQKYRNFKKIRHVGINEKEKKKFITLSKKLQDAGSILIILECMNTELAKTITQKLKIPTIGIGASRHCDGQVLVINDILNIDNKSRKLRFTKSYLNLQNQITKAVKKYCNDVISKKFPAKKNSYN